MHMYGKVLNRLRKMDVDRIALEELELRLHKNFIKKFSQDVVPLIGYYGFPFRHIFIVCLVWASL